MHTKKVAVRLRKQKRHIHVYQSIRAITKSNQRIKCLRTLGYRQSKLKFLTKLQECHLME